MQVAPGVHLGPYEILSPIGAGGMGEVWKARDTRLDRGVAIKILPAVFAENAELKIRFEREAKTISQLEHPNICRLYDVGESDTISYLVMELLDGESLRAKLGDGLGAREAHLPPRKALEYAVQLADGLAAAHERGIVHRDLKPENIFITKTGRVKILDFGLAKHTLPEKGDLTTDRTAYRDTSPGTVMGTAGYMSPEQVRGQVVDHRTDIFAFGTVLYEMVSGRRAFHGESGVETMNAILHSDPSDLDPSVSQVNPALNHIIRHCLEKNPDERFQSVRDLGFDLQTMATGSGAAPAVVGRAAKDRKGLGLIVAVAAAGIALGSGITALVKRGEPAAPESRSLVQLTFQTGVERYPSLSPDGKTFVFVSDGAGNPDIHLQRVDGRNAINLTKDSVVADLQPAFSPDGERIAFRSERDGGGIFIMGATGESVRRLTDFGYNPSWSPDGSEIVISGESVGLNPRGRSTKGGLWIVNVKSGAEKVLTRHDSAQPSWSPLGERIAFWGLVGEGGQRDIWTIAAHAPDSDKSIVPITSDKHLDWNPFWSADGKTLYFGSDRDGTMNLWRIAIDEKSGRTEGVPHPLNLPTEFAAHFSAARAVNAIAFAGISSTNAIDRYALDATAPAPRPPSTVFSGSMPINSFAVSADGKQIAFASFGAQEDLFVMNSDGTNVRQITNDSERDRGPSWSPDGSRIYFYSHRGDRYEIYSIRPDGSGLTQITRTPGVSVWFPRPSPDGSRLLVYNGSGSSIWNLAASRYEPLPQPDSQHVIMDPRWSPDGRRIAGMSNRASDVSQNDGIVIYSFDTKRYEKLCDDPADAAVWLPDGQRIIFSSRRRLTMIDVATKQRRDLKINAGVGGAGGVSAAPDGKSVYVLSSNTEGDVWLMTHKSPR